MLTRARTWILLAVVLALAAVLAGCDTGPRTAELEVDMVEFMFEPQSWQVPAGAEVTITMVNSGTVEHEWVLMEQGYTAEVPFDAEDEDRVYWEGEVEPGDTETFTFTAPSEPGEYQVICAIPGHFEAGMIGSLTVTQ